MKKFFFLCSLLLPLLWHPLIADGPPPKHSQPAKIVSEGITDFGWDLLISTSRSDKNTLISPYSVYSALSMCAAGADGETLSQFKKILNLPSNLSAVAAALSAEEKSLKDHLQVGNAMWIAPQFFIEPAYQKTIETGFNAGVANVDFSKPSEAAAKINQWVAGKTQQKITNLLTPEDLGIATKLVLTNALYFSGQFLKPFSKDMTSVKPFWTDEAMQIQVATMEKTASSFYAEDSTFQVLLLPFQEVKVALAIFLPKAKTFTPLAPLLSAKQFLALLDQAGFKKVHIQLPKFTLEQRYDLNSYLEQMGLSNPFSSSADFSGIDGKHDLFLSKVVHQAFFALDENGVIAAAATSAGMSIKSAAPDLTPEIEFNADHPFLFALVDLDTKIPLFFGQLSSP